MIFILEGQEHGTKTLIRLAERARLKKIEYQFCVK